MHLVITLYLDSATLRAQLLTLISKKHSISAQDQLKTHQVVPWLRAPGVPLNQKERESWKFGVLSQIWSPQDGDTCPLFQCDPYWWNEAWVGSAQIWMDLRL